MSWGAGARQRDSDLIFPASVAPRPHLVQDLPNRRSGVGRRRVPARSEGYRGPRSAATQAARRSHGSHSLKMPLSFCRVLYHCPHSQAFGLELAMISSVLALAAAAAAAQASDTTRTAREAFTACLRTYVNRSIDARTEAATFETEYPQQCTAQQTAFREAIIRRDMAMRSTRNSAEESARLEIEDARANFSERFAAAMTPRSQ